MSRSRTCDVCDDGLGFYARPCPAKRCGHQKPLSNLMAVIYQWPPGLLMTEPMHKDSLRLRYPNRKVR